jgi:addiction module HigA family antidote
MWVSSSRKDYEGCLAHARKDGSITKNARLAAHTPGELLREEILPALDRPKTEIARLLGVSRRTLYGILEEKQPVTPMMALRLGKLCGNGPNLWLNLQKRYGPACVQSGKMTCRRRY